MVMDDVDTQVQCEEVYGEQPTPEELHELVEWPEDQG